MLICLGSVVTVCQRYQADCPFVKRDDKVIYIAFKKSSKATILANGCSFLLVTNFL